MIDRSEASSFGSFQDRNGENDGCFQCVCCIASQAHSTPAIITRQTLTTILVWS